MRDGTRKAVKKTCRWHVFRPWESPIGRRPKLKIYSKWCEKRGYVYYVKPSQYEKTRKARGYVEASSTCNHLTEAEYKKNETINRKLFNEGLYPYIENAGSVPSAVKV